jgi:hypothetical protein
VAGAEVGGDGHGVHEAYRTAVVLSIKPCVFKTRAGGEVVEAPRPNRIEFRRMVPCRTEENYSNQISENNHEVLQSVHTCLAETTSNLRLPITMCCIEQRTPLLGNILSGGRCSKGRKIFWGCDAQSRVRKSVHTVP